MKLQQVKVHPSKADLKREDQLAWKIAEVAADRVPVEKDVAAMIVNRIIDNAAVAIAAINRRPVVSARDMALGHPRARRRRPCSACSRRNGSVPEWAAWANGTAVRELDMHDTFLAADYSHPGDNIPPILAVAQTMEQVGARADPRHRDRLRDPDRPRARDLPARAQDRPHRPSLPGAGGRHRHAAAAPTPRRSTRRCSRRCMSASPRASRARARSARWKAYAPAHAGKLAVEAVDRAMRGEGAPSPIYEGEDSVIAWMLGGPKRDYEVPLPEPGEAEARDPGQLHQGAQRRIPVARR